MPISDANTKSVTRPLEYYFRKADKDFNKNRYAHTEYEFSNGRKFKVRDYRTRHPYNQ